MMYTEKVLEHFRNPHNQGKIENPTVIGEVGNIKCGDVMKMYLNIDNDVITDVKFETYGCASAIATSSVATDLVMGKTIEEALKIKNEDVIKELEDLPRIKIHCSLLAVDALNDAIYKYLKMQNRNISEELEEKHKRLNTCSH